MYLYQATNKRLVQIFQIQKSNILYLENTCYVFNVDVFLFKLKINSMKNLT
jgi:hypothetical protein